VDVNIGRLQTPGRSTDATRVIVCCPGMELTLSVALATYNGACYLRPQLESLAAQTRPPSELLVSDDCSADDTLAIAEEFARFAPFPVTIRKNTKNIGFRANFMLAASQCKSDLIAFCDQDDVWYPEKLAKIVQCFAADDRALLVYHNADIVDEQLRPLGRLHAIMRSENITFPPLSLAPRVVSLGFTQTIRRPLLAFNPYWGVSLEDGPVGRPQPMAHDRWFFFLAGALGRIIFCPLPLVAYRQHGANLYGRLRSESFGEKMRSVFVNHSERYKWLALVADTRADVLASASALSGTNPLFASVDHAISKYRAFANLWRLRAAACGASRFSERVAALRKLIAAAGSSDTSWGLGYKSLLKDIFAVLL
jgi:glycosyltransferase involved in cell wall biosynthesis